MWTRDLEELYQELQDYHKWWRIQYLPLSVGDVGECRVGALEAAERGIFVTHKNAY